MVQYALKMTHDDEVGLPPHYAPTGKMPKPLTDAEVKDVAVEIGVHCVQTRRLGRAPFAKVLVEYL